MTIAVIDAVVIEANKLADNWVSAQFHLSPTASSAMLPDRTLWLLIFFVIK